MAAQTWTNIGLIARREYQARVRTKGFAVATTIMALLALVVAFTPLIIRALSERDAQTRIALLDQSGQVAGQNVDQLIVALGQALNASPDRAALPAGAASSKPAFIVTRAAGSRATLEQQVRAGKLESLLVVERKPAGELAFTYLTRKDPDDNSVAQVRQAMNLLAVRDRLQRAGLSAAEQQAVFSPAAFDVTSTSASAFNNGKSGAQNFANYLITFALVLLIFTMTQTYSNWVGQGVVEEKSSRIVEILINAATPIQLMFGKLFGIGAAALTQFGAIVTSAALGFVVQSRLSDALWGASDSAKIDISGASVGLLLVGLLFFLLGFALYCTLAAGLASLVSRPEEVQQAIGPLTVLMLPGYMLAAFAMTTINQTWVRVLSFVPFFSPFLMISRIGLGKVAPIEVVIALLLLALTIVLMGVLAAKLYRRGILLYGQKPKLWSILRERPGASGLGQASGSHV